MSIDEAGGQAITHGVTRQTAGICVLPDLLESSESLGMKRTHQRVVDRLMTLNARLRSGVVRGRTE
jgi:hypothetical protein